MSSSNGGSETRSAAGETWRAVLRRRRRRRLWQPVAVSRELLEASVVDVSHLVERLTGVCVDRVTLDEWRQSTITIEIDGRWG